MTSRTVVLCVVSCKKDVVEVELGHLTEILVASLLIGRYLARIMLILFLDRSYLSVKYDERGTI